MPAAGSFQCFNMHEEMLHPPKSRHMQAQNRRNRLIQTTLLLLVCIALCCIVVEAFFIYNLYQKNTESHPETPWTDTQYVGEKKMSPEKANLPLFLKPLKPLAHLTAVEEKPNKDGVMQWNDTKSIRQELEYSEGKLVVQKEGYYYIYSKVSFSPNSIFIHSVRNLTPRYQGKALELLRDRRYQPNSALKNKLRSSYLGGIFHLYNKDAIFVHVNDGSLVRLQSHGDNFFGMFML